jgi:mRNA interferase RelE/StbE
VYKIEFKKSALKELKKLPRKEQISILSAIKKLAENPIPVGYKKMVGSESTYRIRVGNYRIIYNIYKKELFIEIIRVGHRKDIYR